MASEEAGEGGQGLKLPNKVLLLVLFPGVLLNVMMKPQLGLNLALFREEKCWGPFSLWGGEGVPRLNHEFLSGPGESKGLM